MIYITLVIYSLLISTTKICLIVKAEFKEIIEDNCSLTRNSEGSSHDFFFSVFKFIPKLIRISLLKRLFIVLSEALFYYFHSPI